MGKGQARNRHAVLTQASTRSVLLAHTKPTSTRDAGYESVIKQAVELLEANTILLDLCVRTTPEAIACVASTELTALIKEVESAGLGLNKARADLEHQHGILYTLYDTFLPNATRYLERATVSLSDHEGLAKSIEDVVSFLSQTQLTLKDMESRIERMSNTLYAETNAVQLHEQRLLDASEALFDERLARKNRKRFKKRSKTNLTQDTFATLVFGLPSIPADFLLEHVPMTSVPSGKLVTVCYQVFTPSKRKYRTLTTVGELRSAMADGCQFTSLPGPLWEKAPVVYAVSDRSGSLAWEDIQLDLSELARTLAKRIQKP